MSIPLWLMIAGLASSVIFGGLQIWQNSATNGRNVDLQRENNDLQRQLAGQANEWNIQQWNRENAYNNPSAQLARLAGAGLNPSLIYGQGGLVNEAAASPAATMANTRSAQIQSPLSNVNSPLDPLTAAQVANLNAQTAKTEAETKYQNYMNQVEEQLANSPIRYSIVNGPNGESDIKFEYGNARVEMTRSELRMLGLSENGLRTELADAIFDLAVRVGDYSFTDLSSFDPLQTEGGIAESNALKGEREVRRLSGELARIGYDAALAEKSGQTAYADWLKKHGDEPLVKLALAIQGFLQSTGISLPSISLESGKNAKGQMARKWFFGR